MAIDKDTVSYVAHLARIRLNEQELDLLSRQLEDIVNFIDKLRELNVDKVKPTSHILAISNVFRQDKSGQSLKGEQVLGNAPLAREDFFVVPKVIE